MNTHIITGKLKAQTASVQQSCSKPAICRCGMTSNEKYIPHSFCTSLQH